MHSCPLSHKYQLLLRPHFQKSIIFKVAHVKFEPNVLELVIRKNFMNSIPFAFLIINVKILSNFQKAWCTFGIKKRSLKTIRIFYSQCLNVLNMQKYF